MIRPFLVLPVLTLCLIACQSVPQRADLVDLAAELTLKTGSMPPKATADACWATDVIPAVIETVTEQVRVQPERRDATGTVIGAAVFRTETQQKLVQERREVWFRAPCPHRITLDFVASLQRALKARGLYEADVTGQLDAPTRQAIRRYQDPLGLDSERLSLAAARSLGLIAGEFETR